MKKLMDFIVLSCKKATFLIEKGYSQPLSFLDRMQLSMHLKICEKCSRYQKQSLMIEQLLTQTPEKFSQSADFKLSDASKSRIHKAVQENYKNN